MKRIWNLALGTAVLCTALLCGCALSGTTAPDSAAPTDPLTGQELQYPGSVSVAPHFTQRIAFSSDTSF